MLRIVAIALLATSMSVGLAEAKGAKAKALPTCQTEQQASAKCACGPAKKVCEKGQWCHGFMNACTQ
jgi:hypothetical protein